MTMTGKTRYIDRRNQCCFNFKAELQKIKNQDTFTRIVCLVTSNMSQIEALAKWPNLSVLYNL